MLAAALAGCARHADGNVARGRVIVNYWEKWSGFEADAMQAVVDDFNRSQDRIEVRFLSVSEVDTKLLLAASSGHPPDVAGLWSENIPDFSEKGALTPLDGGLAAAGIGADHYIPVYWELCRHRGFTWGLPTTPGGGRGRRRPTAWTTGAISARVSAFSSRDRRLSWEDSRRWWSRVPGGQTSSRNTLPAWNWEARRAPRLASRPSPSTT